MMIHDQMGGPQPVFGAISDRGRERAAQIGPSMSLLGWTPQTGLDRGLRSTIEFYTWPFPGAGSDDY